MVDIAQDAMVANMNLCCCLQLHHHASLYSVPLPAECKLTFTCRALYLSLDEASGHVDTRRFRLIIGIYDASDKQLLGSTCSPLIRVLANNDCPGGAAYIPLKISLR